MSDWRIVAAVALGGALGSVARFLLSSLLTRGGQPIVGTLVVNVVGCLLIGLLLAGPAPLASTARAFLAVGLLGGFTTMSSFSHESIALFEAKKIGLAALNVVATIATCLGGTWIGRLIGRALSSG